MKSKRIRLFFLSLISVMIIAICVYGIEKLSVSTYVSLDINPGIEIRMNRFGDVIAVSAADKEAEALFKEIDLNQKNLESVIVTILETFQNQEYFSDKNPALILLTFCNTKESETVIEQVETVLSDFFDEQQLNVILVIQSFDINSTYVNQANELNITVGRFYLMEQLIQADPSLNLANLSTLSVYDLLTIADQLNIQLNASIVSYENDNFDVLTSATIESSNDLYDMISAATEVTNSPDAISSPTTTNPNQQYPDASSSATVDNDNTDYNDDHDDDDDEHDTDEEHERDESLTYFVIHGLILSLR